MWARTWAFLIWASVAAVAVFWGLRLFGTSPQPPTHAQPAPAQGVVRADLSRVLGADPIAAPAPAAPAEPAVDQSRFQLLGVIAAGAAGGQGYLIQSLGGAGLSSLSETTAPGGSGGTIAATFSALPGPEIPYQTNILVSGQPTANQTIPWLIPSAAIQASSIGGAGSAGSAGAGTPSSTS